MKDDAFTVVIPYFDEADYLPATLRSLLAQSRPPDAWILVDNDSADGSARIAREVLAEGGVDEALFLQEPRPGKVHALEKGAAAVASEFVAFCDADTIYPSHYLALCGELFRSSGSDVVALMALPVYGDPGSAISRLRRRYFVGVSRVLRKQAFTGGYGQVVRTDTLRDAGGYSEEAWPYVLMDHELVHRLHRHGRILYHPDLWCRPSQRRRDRGAVRWSLAERLLYHVTPYSLKDRFFYDFLGPRFERRGLSQLAIRYRPWSEGEEG